jgi:hypothetical protein
VLSAAEPDVDAELDTFFDACQTSYAQQTRPWRDVIFGMGVDEPLFLGCRDAGVLVGVLPAYRFDGPLGAILTSVPQAGPLGGVACRASPREPVYEALTGAFLELARERGCALASLITSPIWPDRSLYERCRQPDFALDNSCLVLDLDEALDAAGELVAQPSNLRRNLRKAGSAALVIDEDQTEGNVHRFYAIHEQRQREIGVTPLPLRLFSLALEHAVPAGVARFFFVRRAADGEMLAGGFYVCHGAVIDAFMPAMRSDAAALAPNFRLAHHTIGWARRRGLRFYNWQASPPGGGVDRFKRQWGSRDHDYAYLTWITGDAEAILAANVSDITSGYPWHYVVPFDRLGAASEAARGPSSRAAAWGARESAK